ncbi:AMP-binding protein [Rhodocyclus tenuis]|uniref:Long-chain acyl-CoA synthetase n=1 Tax=Rhodocyclus tenuis TaxID=1066 RepID=A0A840G2S0_RHOTE|nr:AMP-binding protein [Rhodocyclus tenuis]MBB4248624.1 long-chain acyl-CoA synthetase [Rhodocyclus tenuis]
MDVEADSEVGIKAGQQTVRALLERRAVESPDAVYLIAPETGRQLSFSGLAQAAATVDALLQAHGVASGERVALLLPNGLQAVSLFVGVMAAGRVVTPLSLLAQPAQLAWVIEHSGCRLIFAGSEQAATARAALALSGSAAELVVVDADGEVAMPDSAAEAPYRQSAAPAAGDAALLMYTSGTTGRPKGVVLTHANVCAGARFVSAAHALGVSDRVLAVLPLYHINAQIVTVLATLQHGGSLLMPRRFSASAFWSLAADYRCTWLNVVPTMIAYLLDGTDPSAGGLGLTRLRFCRSASAPLSPEHHRAFEARFGIGIIETMGLTETAAPVFSNPLAAERRKIGSPGQAFGNEARIVDLASGTVLPDGAAGEIQIRGANVMRGYFRAPEETARAISSDGWLRTGDLGYRDGDGFYFITGRLKELIIKGGENIAPREIDEALLKHPAVLEAAAFGVADAAYGQEIEAGVVLKPGLASDEAELRAFCQRELGRFKTPRAIRILSELPKGPSGKVQRLRLQED